MLAERGVGLGRLRITFGPDAGGFGFRYLVARALNFRSGIDVGFSEEDTAIYLTFGTAWML